MIPLPRSTITIPQPHPTQCYCWGSGAGGALGYDSKGSIRKSELKPVALGITTCASRTTNIHDNMTQNTNSVSPSSSLSSPSHIAHVSAGYQRSTFITVDGECYSNGSGPLGRRTRSFPNRCRPSRINIRNRDGTKGKVVNAVHGESHSALLTNEGVVLVFGDASNGKLGLATGKRRGEVMLPTAISIPTLYGGAKKKCINVACSHMSTMILLDNDEGEVCAKTQPRQVLMFGTVSGILLKKKSPACQSLQFPTAAIITTISSGPSHCAAVCAAGVIYTWGLAENGRLGHYGEGEEEMDTIIDTPQRVEHFYRDRIIVSNVACGGAHTCILSQDGKLYACGWNAYYQCGLAHISEAVNVLMPNEILLDDKGLVATDISCGFAHSAAVMAYGELYTWGFNEEGQLGLGHENNVKDPTLVNFSTTSRLDDMDTTRYVISVSCGHTHTLCVTSTHTSSQCSDRRREIDTLIRARDILHRFVRRSLIYIRLKNRYHPRVIVKVLYSPEKLVEQSVTQPPCSIEDISMTSSTPELVITPNSIHSDKIELKENSSNVSPIDDTNTDEASMQELESLRMKIEDNRSRQLSRFDNKVRATHDRVKRVVIKETMRQWEIINMAREDIFAMVRQDTEEEALRIRQRAELHDKASARNERISEQIRKEADRLLVARHRRCLEKKKIQFKPTDRSKLIRRKNYRKTPCRDNKVFNTPPTINLHDDRWNKLLLQRRQARIIKQNQMKKEEVERRKLKMIVEERQKIERLYVHAGEMDKVKKKWMLKNKFELMQMKENLVAPKQCQRSSDEHGDINGDFRSVSQWTSELS